MYRASEFRDYFSGVAKPNTVNTYNSFLSRIDKAIGGLDEAISRDGSDAVMKWSDTTNASPFDASRSHARSVLKRYLQFHIGLQAPDDEGDISDAADPLETQGASFRIERELQQAARKQLTLIEAGLHQIDNGFEVSVSTGRIDILAQDNVGRLVVIELKAGLCPPGAIEQAIGYAQALADERSVQDVRTILIAAEFNERSRFAARCIPGLQLMKYDFILRFESVK